MKYKIIKALDLTRFFIYNRIASLFLPLENNKVIFLSEAHPSLDGNLKAVYDKIEKENIVKKVYVKPDRRQRYSANERRKLWKDMTSARYIFLDDFYGLTSAMKLRRGQELVQLWHGSGAFKKFGFSRVNTGDKIKRVNGGYRKYTKVTVTSENVRNCFAEAFDIPVERVQPMGSPRTDFFFSREAREEALKRVYGVFPQLVGKKVVFIATTYRGRKVEDAYYDFERLNLDRMTSDLGDDYQIMVKWHPALYSNMTRGLCQNPSVHGVIDASNYKNVNDLLLVTDVLVTDYSSIIFDYFLTGKPVVYYVYDKNNYADNRGFYYNFNEYLYGTSAENYDELIKAIIDENLCEYKRKQFGDKFMKACDGKSTQRVINWVLGEVSNE